MSGTTPKSRAHNIGAYFFYIENLPKRYTWQHLKDLVRKEASHGIWTEMAFFPSGQPGSTGWARVQRTDEAKKLYSYLTNGEVEGRGLRVHLWDCSQSTPSVMICNCKENNVHGPQGAVVSRMAGDASWKSISSVSQTPVITPASPAYPVSPPVQYAVSPATAPLASQSANQNVVAAATDLLKRIYVNRNDQTLLASWQRLRNDYPQEAQRATQALQAQLAPTTAPQQHVYQSPMYMSTANGTPVNVSRGAVRTEHRGIFVSGLNYKAHRKDIETLFSRAGRITAFDLQKDPATGKPKGNATVQYASAEEASTAIREFNGSSFMKMRLNVRVDTEATAISTPTGSSLGPQAQKKSAGPLIVNGSSTPQASRRKDSVVSGTSASIC